MGMCKTCKGGTDEYKCDMCGAESAHHDDTHDCGGSHCVQKCTGCGEAETKCSCES